MTSELPLSGAKRQLLERLLRGEVARQNWEAVIGPRPLGAPAPLAPSQHQIWLHSQMAPSVPVYNEPITIRRHGPLDRMILEQTLSEILRRHEIWRTTFATVDDQVIQKVQDHVAIQIPYSDLSSLPEQEREATAVKIATDEAQLPFDLNLGPLLRSHLLRLGEDRYRLHLTLHHLIFDGMTAYHVLLPELATLYDAFSKGQPSPLLEPRLQYADYALWQKRLLENDSVASQLSYWRETLSGAETAGVYLPADRLRPAVPTFRGGTETFAFPPALFESMKRACREEGVTMYMLLLACFQALLHRYSGQEDVIVGGVTDGRRRAEFESLMGCFTNTVVLRTKPSAEMTFHEFLSQVKDTVLGAVANGDVPFDSVVRELQPKRDPSRNAFYQVMLAMGPPPGKARESAWELEHLGINTGASKLDLYFAVDEGADGMAGRFHYSSDLFDASTIRRMICHWLRLVESAVGEPGARLCDLTVMTAAETRDLIHHRNATAREIPHATIHELFEQQAKLSPNAVAVEAVGVRLTYRQLNERANRLARRLRRAGVTPDTLVALCVDRTVDLIVAPLAVLKAGGAYLPLDPAFPRERLAFLVEDAQAPFLLTARALEVTCRRRAHNECTATRPTRTAPISRQPRHRKPWRMYSIHRGRLAGRRASRFSIERWSICCSPCSASLDS